MELEGERGKTKQWDLFVEELPKCSVCGEKISENSMAWFDEKFEELCCDSCTRTTKDGRKDEIPKFIDDNNRGNVIYRVVIRT